MSAATDREYAKLTEEFIKKMRAVKAPVHEYESALEDAIETLKQEKDAVG